MEAATPTLNNPVNYIFIHHTAVSRAQNPDQWEQTNEYHKMKWNFKSSLGLYVGYTYEIAANGTVRQARAIGEETAAVIGYNFNSVSICLDGNFDIEKPTIAQMKALRALLVEIMGMKGVTVSIRNVLPHRGSYDLLHEPEQKSCYGRLLPDTWAQSLVLQPEVDGIDENPPLGEAQTVDRGC